MKVRLTIVAVLEAVGIDTDQVGLSTINVEVILPADTRATTTIERHC